MYLAKCENVARTHQWTELRCRHIGGARIYVGIAEQLVANSSIWHALAHGQDDYSQYGQSERQCHIESSQSDTDTFRATYLFDKNIEGAFNCNEESFYFNAANFCFTLRTWLRRVTYRVPHHNAPPRLRICMANAFRIKRMKQCHKFSN